MKKSRSVEQGGNPRDVKFDFAKEIVARFHGEAAAAAAAADFEARFRRDEIPDDIPEVRLTVEGRRRLRCRRC